MNVDKKAMRLYLVTDRSWLGENDLLSQTELALRAGVTFLQLREKELEHGAFLEEARRMRRLARQYGVPFVVNDNVEIALESGADGVHIGQEDQAAAEVRALLGPDKILGVSANTVEQALAAERAGADYLGVGAVFSTSTKLDADHVSFDTLKAICHAVKLPIVAIGGINADNILLLRGSGAHGAAVISAVYAQANPYKAAKKLRILAEQFSAQ